MVENIVHLTNDKGVIKKIIKEGEEGPEPAEGQEVLVHYTGRLTDGTIFDTSDDKEPLKIVIGVG